MSSHALYKFLRVPLIFIIVVSLTVSFLAVGRVSATPARSSYDYKFFVDENGFTRTTVDFLSFQAQGSSWIFVPDSQNWTRNLLSGKILRSELVDTQKVANIELAPFYKAFKFSYKSDEPFKITFQFNMSEAAIVIEPLGMFFSPQVGFEKDSSGKAEVFLPKNSRLVKALAMGKFVSYGPTEKTPDYALFNLRENIVRLQIEFKTSVSKPELTTIKRGVFTFQTVKRYERHASNILDLFDTTYRSFTNFFDVTLESVELEFFIPEFNTILSIGGYVLFSGGKVGDIHINLFFVRSVKGALEVIALHELIHHFLLKAGLSPDIFLWFHEGMAQYISIETADGMSYEEGASWERDKLENSALELLQLTGGNFHFLQDWRPGTQPANIGAYYTASYYVVSRLAKKYGGLNYYKRFFKLLEGVEVEDNSILAYYLSLAANASVVPALRNWGFNVTDLYASSTLVDEGERAVHGLNPVFQPYKFLTEYLYRQALTSFERGDVEKANRYLETAIFIAMYAPLLTVITIAVIFAAIIYAFERRRAPSKPTASNSW